MRIPTWTLAAALACAPANADPAPAADPRTIASATDEGKCLDVKGARASNGAHIQLWSCNGTDGQKWRLRDAGEGWFTLVSSLGGKCLDVAGGNPTEGTPVQLYACNSTKAQRWRVRTDAKSGRVTFESAIAENRCLDVKAGISDDGAKVRIWSCNTTSAQQWRSK